MQPRHRTFAHVSDVLLESVPLQARHIQGFTHQPLRSQPAGFNSQTTTRQFFLLKWLSEQSLLFSVKVFFVFFYFLAPSSFLWFFVVDLFLVACFFVYFSFLYCWCSWGIFLFVIWFLTVLFFIDSEFVFLWFWPENLLFVQVIFLGFLSLLLLYNII